MKCPRGECHVGAIANRLIEEKDWIIESFKFEGKIELWNELTKHREVPHIGYVVVFKYCTKCGVEIREGQYPYSLGGKIKHLRAGTPI